IAAYAELLRPLALGRQLVAGLQVAGPQPVADALADLLEGAAGLDGREMQRFVCGLHEDSCSLTFRHRGSNTTAEVGAMSKVFSGELMERYAEAHWTSWGRARRCRSTRRVRWRTGASNSS